MTRYFVVTTGRGKVYVIRALTLGHSKQIAESRIKNDIIASVVEADETINV